MRRALRRAVGVLLAAGILGLARPALAQTSPVRRAGYGQGVVRSEGQGRLEEMKVELALLADVATFPYYLGARVAGGALEVRGYVPNEAVMRRALELARRHTSLAVTNGLRFQTNLSPRRPLRGAEEVLREGSELLARELGNASRKLHLDAGPNGVIRVTGPIDSVQEKLAVSRLFRQISGCAAVVNQLTVQPILCDGQRVVPITRDHAQTAPAAALPYQEPVDRPLEAREEELHLPTIAATKPARGQTSEGPTIKPVKASKSDRFASESTAGDDSTTKLSPALSTPQLPANWSRPRFKPESQTQAVPAPPPPLPPVAPPAPAPEPAIIGSSVHTPAVEPPSQPTPDPPTPPVGPAIRSPRPWPPAYDVRPPQPTGGRTGMVIFEEAPVPAPVPVPMPAPAPVPVPMPAPAAQGSLTSMYRAIASAELKQQIKSVCGRKAREVKVEVQHDGSLLVKVKVPNLAAEKELTGKILTIPALSTPNVHLAVEVSP